MGKYTLYIKIDDSDLKSKYESHGTFNIGDSGLDLFTPHDVEVKCGETTFVKLGIKCEMKEFNSSNHGQNVSYYLYPRSSISKTPLILKNSVGIVDAGYRGEITAAFYYTPTTEDLFTISNTGNTPSYTIKKGTRLVQICAPDLSPFKFVLKDELSDTTRGEGGYGSTGV